MKTETLLPLGKLDPGLAAPEVPLDPSLVGEQATIADEVGYSSLLMEETKDFYQDIVGLILEYDLSQTTA